MLTVAVIAIVFTAPLGAILINTLGIKWLTYDGEETEDKGQEMKEIAQDDESAEKKGSEKLTLVKPVED